MTLFLALYRPPFNKTILSFVLYLFASTNTLAINTPLNIRRGCKAPNDSDVVLKWVVPADACNSFQAYYIYARKDTFSPFNLIDSVKTLSQQQYTHKGAFLLANTWQYFIVMHFDCFGNPTIASDTLSIDLTQTNNQYIDSVSVDPVSGKYVIGWKTNGSKDLAGYKIYTISGTNNIILNDVDNKTNVYTDNSSSPSANTITYSIAAYDSCNNITAILDKHTPIKLSVRFDSCSRAFDISWTGYIGFPLLKYEILASINGGYFFVVKNFLAVSGVLNFSLVDTSFHDGDNVCFVVRAISSGSAASSSSNGVCMIIKFISLANINYISTVSVITKSTIRIDWLTDAPTLINSLLFQQSTDGINFITRKIISPTLPAFSFFADSLNTDELKYYFRIIIFNSCNQIQDTSNICNSILLHVKKASTSSNQLVWGNYLNFNSGVGSYEIYQGTGDPILGHTYNLLKIVTPDSLKFLDSNFPGDILNDGVCYYVIAVENPGNAYGVIGASSKSNEICVAGDLLVFFPNAFNPASTISSNKVFMPRGLYIDYEHSWIKIYDRWGALVFESNSLLTGWDGTDANHVPLPAGPYIFLSTIASLKSNGQNIKGLVNLIR